MPHPYFILQKGASSDLDKVTDLLAQMEKMLVDSKEQLTPLHLAARDGIEKLVVHLVDNGASATATTTDGSTPLHFGAKNGNEQNIIKLLTAQPNAIKLKDDEGNTSLPVMVKEGNLEGAEVLLGAGADMDVQDKDGNTPLHIAVCLGDLELIELFAFRGSNKQARNKEGKTPFDLAKELDIDGDYEQIIDILEW